MCYIVYAPQGAELQNSWFESAVAHNNCGFGVAVMGDEPHVEKFLSFEPFLERIKSLESNVDRLIHMRFATVGNISLDNTQPILLGNRVIAHNGTIRGYGDKNVSDSVDFAKKVLSRFSWKELVLKKQELEKFLGYSKIVIVEDGKTLILNERLGTWHAGCWHSTAEFLSSPDSSDYDESFVILDAMLRLKKVAKDWRLPHDLRDEIQEVIDNLDWLLYLN